MMTTSSVSIVGHAPAAGHYRRVHTNPSSQVIRKWRPPVRSHARRPGGDEKISRSSSQKIRCLSPAHDPANVARRSSPPAQAQAQAPLVLRLACQLGAASVYALVAIDCPTVSCLGRRLDLSNGRDSRRELGSMGRAARQRLDDKKRQLFAAHSDDRSAEQRALARATLDALQKKLEDDALREDGFFFLDGEFAAARRPRISSGMKARSFDGHTRSVKALVLVRLGDGAEVPTRGGAAPTSVVVTFGVDRCERRLLRRRWLASSPHRHLCRV